jgi:hypothetical protein
MRFAPPKPARRAPRREIADAHTARVSDPVTTNATAPWNFGTFASHRARGQRRRRDPIRSKLRATESNSARIARATRSRRVLPGPEARRRVPTHRNQSVGTRGRFCCSYRVRVRTVSARRPMQPKYERTYRKPACCGADHSSWPDSRCSSAGMPEADALLVSGLAERQPISYGRESDISRSTPMAEPPSQSAGSVARRVLETSLRTWLRTQKH